MKKYSWFLAAFTVSALLVLSGCDAGDSGDGSGDNGPGNPSAYQQGSDLCSEQFVLDYNSIHYAAQELEVLPNQDNLNKLQNLVAQFSQNYSGVNCKMQLTNTDTFQTTDDYVNVNDLVAKLQTSLNQINSTETPAPGQPNSSESVAPQPAPNSSVIPQPSASPSMSSAGVPFCSDAFEESYMKITAEYDDAATTQQLTTFLNHLDLWVAQYPGLKCFASAGIVIDLPEQALEWRENAHTKLSLNNNPNQ